MADVDAPYDPNDTINSSVVSADTTLPNADDVLSPEKSASANDEVANGEVANGEVANGDVSHVDTNQEEAQDGTAVDEAVAETVEEKVEEAVDDAADEVADVEDIKPLLPKTFYKDGELAPADCLWTTKAGGAVKSRISDTNKEIPTETVHSAIARAVKNFPNNIALATKRNGVWMKWTYTEYYSDVRSAAKGFLKLGLERYHGVGIIGFNSPEWFICSMGSMFAGGLGTGIYTTNSAEACQYVADNCQANVIVVENKTHLNKILKVWDKLPHLKAIVQYSGKLEEKRDNVYTWSEFMEIGQDVPDADLDDIINSQAPNHCCTLIYTSGTTGNPKGVMVSHDGFLWQAKSCAKAAHLKQGVESVVSYLPVSHVLAQLFDIYIPLVTCGAVYFAQHDALKGTLVTTLKEVRPTGFIGVPRVWEKIQEKMKSIGASNTGFKKRIGDWAKDIGLRGHAALEKRAMQSNQGWWQYFWGVISEPLPWGWTLANLLVFRKVRQALGLDRCFLTFSAGAPIATDTLNYFLSINIPVYDIYGMSESSGPHTISMPDCYKMGSAGQCLAGAETKIHDPDKDGIGEVCYNGRHVFMGYLNMEEKTRETLDEDGWLHSGDLGYVDDKGFLYITGRIKELIITAGGENVPPVPIEDSILNETAILSNCMLIGDQRKFLSIIVTLKVKIDEASQESTEDLNGEALAICKKLGSEAKTVAEAETDEKISQHIQKGIDAYNKQAASRAQMVQKWKILRKDFTVAGGELGPTLKLKRPIVTKQYAELIDSIYGES
ncbi:long-chain-fatty-acid--CoA ligase ACSBG2-like isoform X1 [Asterias rubens]|uniref:long-chain-fatty-acid--CoA ligase ACSBG2-like isoform X1 n=1 Tax=Asterias rubens TaxID=7604 RepID=UPI001455709B|nr:long-chain-fatty-acid--CoA ligase ACSBG2-like isoform X1 [Asterias rubens]